MSTPFQTLLESLTDQRRTLVPLSLIDPDPDQPRRTFDRAALNDLAADIAAQGVMQPITVCAVGERFRIVMGERRFRASKIAKLDEIPALLGTVDDGEVDSFDLRLQQLAENHHRADLNPMDLARFLRRLRDEFSMSATAIAQTLKDRGFRDMGRSYVSNTIRLTELAEPFQKAIEQGTMPAGHGKYLLQAPNGAEASAALDTALAEHAEDVGGAEHLTTWEVRQAVLQAWSSVAFPLDGRYSGDLQRASGYSQAQFDVAVCDGCAQRKAIRVEGDEYVFCSDRAAFLEKQAAAVASPKEQTAAPREVPRVVTPEEREQRLRGDVHDHLTEWLRDRIGARLTQDNAARLRFFFWAAAGATTLSFAGDGAAYFHGALHVFLDDGDHPSLLEAVGDPLLLDLLPEVDLLNVMVEELDDQQIWRWALALDIGLQTWTLDDGYLDALDKRELLILAKDLRTPQAEATAQDALIAAILSAAPAGFQVSRVADVYSSTRAAHDAVIAKYRDLQATPQEVAA